VKSVVWVSMIILLSLSLGSNAQEDAGSEVDDLKAMEERLKHRFDVLNKKIDDVIWFERVGNVAFIDKVYMTGPPLKDEENPTAQGAGNPVKFWAYVFIPKDIDPSKKYPLLVFPHGGVHSNLSTYYTHIIRELMYQKYIVVAAEYRGSTGYGRDHYRKIDYGGLEIDDVGASRQYMIDNYDFVDAGKVGIIGWSHGGLIALHNIFEHPKDYEVAFAGVPVSDLIARMGYKTQQYRDLYSVDYHIGKSAYEDVEEYRRRSPAWQVHKFQNTPLLIHTNTNDADVNVLEVEHLINALKAEGKKFDFEIFEDIPGGHSFDRTDKMIAKEIRVKIYKHLARHLNPERTIKSTDDVNRASYYFLK